MPAPATADEFLDLVRKSGVVDESRLTVHLRKLGGRPGVPDDPQKLAAVLVRDGLLTYFQADQLLQGKWKRFFIGKYKVLERVGTGGMGQVFLCEHKLMRRRVAVKVLPAAKAQDASSLDRFQREARAVAALDHPNIVRAYDIDQDDGLHFLVMEYVDGTSLHDLVRKFGPLDPLRACHYVYGAAVGLEHAHEMGLIHRDIKPGNILVNRSGVVKVLDMGLARFFNDDEDQLTRKYDENILGTADYLAPEQAIDSHSVDIRADLYSLGGTFYYLLTGQPPFPEGTVAQKLLWHQTRDPAPVRSVRPQVPEEVAAVVARMMAKDPARRYQTPAEVMAALAVWVQTPIPPPSDKEMPQLSPAAIGPGAGQITSRGPNGTAPAPALPAGTTGTGEYRFPTPGSDVVRPPAARAPQTPTPATAISPVPTAGAVARPVQAAPAAGVGIWEQLAAETRATAAADTDPPGRSSRRTARRDPAAPRGNRRTVLFAVLGGVGLLAAFAAGLVATYLIVVRKPTADPRPPDEAQTWYVSAKGAGPNPNHTLRSLAGALDRAGSGDVILILDDRIDDQAPVRVSSRAGVKKGVRVEAGNAARSVTWSPRASVGARAVLDVSDVEDFSVSGLVLEVGGAFDYGVVVGRGCPGLSVENVTVLAPKAAGFRLQSAAGEPDRPIRMDRCRVATAGQNDAVAIQFAGGVRSVRIENCPLEGPGKAAFRVDGSVTDAVVRNNRVFNFDVGVLVTGNEPADAPFDLTVANNTFHTLKTGVKIEHPLGPAKTLTLARNYFANTPELATTSAGDVPGFHPAENGRDPATKEGNVPTNSAEVANVQLPTQGTGADKNFLLPAGGVLDAVGPNKAAVGAR